MSGLRLRLYLRQECRQCGDPLDSQRKAEALQVVSIFGLAAGWRWCACRQVVYRLSGRGRRRVYLDPRGTLDWRPE